jgi:hypothetical protein
MSALGTRIASRSTLIGLAVLAASGFAVAAILGNGRHGALHIVADVAWTTFLISALAVVLVGAATLTKSRLASH